MRRGLRVAGWGLIGLLGLAVLAVLATNVLLQTRLLRSLVNAEPDALFVDYQGAASWSPGRLSFDSLTLRSRDQNIEFEAALRGVTLRVSLADLLRRRLHATRLRARTLRFRLREKLTREEATRARLARFPRIAGFSDPPLLQTRPASSANAEVPWRVVIDDLSVERVEEIWIDSWKWNGEGAVAGRFDLLPGLEARVGPARLEVASGALRRGASPVAQRPRGVVWCEFPLFDKKARPGNDVWKILSGGVALRGDLAGLAFLSPDSGGPRLSGGAGSLLARVGLENGAGNARLSVTARDLTVRDGKRVFKGSTQLDVLAPRIDFPRGEASLAGTKLVLTDVSVEGAPGRPWAATFSAPAARLHLTDDRLDSRLVGNLLDARPIIAQMPRGLAKWAATLLHLEDLRFAGHLAVGPSQLALTSLRLSAGDFLLEGDYHSGFGPTHGHFRARKGHLSVRFTVPRGT
ncbi:MAG: hypothetical protein HY900_24680 [Deltaproteobacteria bacterium]|nr:hypothetical protein [Deltaproteobacteria bacterium]